MPETTQSSTITAEVEGIDKEFSDAAIQVDTVTLERIMSDDYIFIGGDGKKMNKEGHIASLKSGDRKYDSLTSADVEVRSFGDAAVLTACVTAVGTAKGKDMSAPYLVSRFYVRQGGQWVIVSAQATRSE